MQIDFHHGATYVIARYAGFSPDEAATIANAAQYVDDSTTSGFIRFDNGMRYLRAATAHPMLDTDNLHNDENTISWLPFHFLPGDDAGGQRYVHKLVCRPDSAVANLMMAAARAESNAPHALHRLGIAAHVFIDTFAHQGFAGLNDEINTASAIQDKDGKALSGYPRLPPVGHGQVGTYPDQPYLVWSYLNADNVRVHRNNPADFLRASHRLCEEFQRYRGVAVTGLTELQEEKLTTVIVSETDKDGEVRHAAWLQKIARDYFGFGAEQVFYTGKERWKTDALGADAVAAWQAACKQKAKATVDQHEARHGTSLLDQIGHWSGKVAQELVERFSSLSDTMGRDVPVECTDASPFLQSDYKKFHDAARSQRNSVLIEILPRVGIYAA